MSSFSSDRRDFLTGRSLARRIEAARSAAVDAVLDEPPTPVAGPTIRLAVRAMACEFGVLLEPGPRTGAARASESLELLPALEQKLSVYRPDSDLSRLNATASERPCPADGELFDLLARCRDLTLMTDGAFDAAVLAQTLLWRGCKSEQRLPDAAEVAAALERSTMRRISLDEAERTITFSSPGMGFDLGAIGKGFAIDRMTDYLTAGGVGRFLVHGGHSSLRAVGGNAGHDGWPVGLGNPLFTSQRLGTVLLVDQAFGTSGSNIQFYRHQGKRLGHILDPRTAWPAEGLLSVSVVAPTAEEADALSTAFFVLGVEKALLLCHNQPLIGVVFIPPPRQGRRLELLVHGIPRDRLFVDPSQACVICLDETESQPDV